jgi:hypothetical protein
MARKTEEIIVASSHIKLLVVVSFPDLVVILE